MQRMLRTHAYFNKFGLVFKTKETPSWFLVERPSTILDVDSGNSLLVVPDPFGTLEISDAPGKFLSLHFFFIFLNSCKGSLSECFP